MQPGLPEGCPFAGIFPQPMIRGYDNPEILGPPQMVDPLGICGVSPFRKVRNVLDVIGRVPLILDEAVEGRRKDRRRAVVEEDLHAAFRVKLASKSIARRTAASLTS